MPIAWRSMPDPWVSDVVYLVVRGGRALYVGQATGYLRNRISTHRTVRSDLRRGALLYYWTFGCACAVRERERRLILRLRPPLNRQFFEPTPPHWICACERTR